MTSDEEDGKEMSKVELKISGMVCASCASTVEGALLGVEGVDEARVNLGKETVFVAYDPSKAKLTDLENAVSEAGYGVVDERVAIKVGGMMCASCVSTVEEAVGGVEGVVEVKVNLGAERAYVTYNPGVASVAEIRGAIEEAGYQYLGVAGEEGERREREAREKDLQDKKRRILVGFGAGLVLMVLGMAPSIPSVPMPFLMLVISTPPFIYLSQPIFSAGLRALRHRSLTMDVMYSMGIAVAFVSSLMGTFGVLLTPQFIFYETAVFLAAFLTLGRYLETRARGRTSEAIKKLVGLQPKTATVIRDGREVEVAAADLLAGEVILVRPGEKVPADGVVVAGESYVDESMITGEPIPAKKKKDDPVVGGTLNRNGAIRFLATRVGRETALAQIIALVEEAQGSKPSIQRLADRAVALFIPTVLTVAALTFLLWRYILADLVPGDPLLFALTATISVLVVACPCALGLASPTAITVGIGRAAELGVLVKRGEALETSEKLNAVVFDKTGTLTVGRPQVTDLIAFGIEEMELLRIAGGIEASSEHPLAEAVVRRARAEGVTLVEPTSFEALGGKGVLARVEGRDAAVGNRVLLRGMGIEIPEDAEDAALCLEVEGKTALFAALDERVVGVVGVADALKEDSGEAVKRLQEMGFEVLMITGDNPSTAGIVAEEIGIERVLAEVLPQEKAREIKRLQDAGSVVAFVGDGINDAPALAQADVGIAIGSGTDVAIESGEIVLIRDDLMDAVAAIELSRKVMGRVKLNLFWAFAYNSALIPVAAGALYPSFGITFRPELAGLAMAASSVTVVSLSLMLKGYVPPSRRERERRAKELMTEEPMVEERLMEEGLTKEGLMAEEKSQQFKEDSEVKGLAIDPVCGMTVDEKTAKFRTEYKGTTYHFCAPGCMKAFEKEPEKYLKG
ncbi:MAG TPA: heavy metal translocating P-type ATPase [Methanothrix sp.]|nr:heavy metal translocating P-type ATPase [Methanothrix sp.]